MNILLRKYKFGTQVKQKLEQNWKAWIPTVSHLGGEAPSIDEALAGHAGRVGQAAINRQGELDGSGRTVGLHAREDGRRRAARRRRHKSY